jgi:small-conductance mechanosensitive channel
LQSIINDKELVVWISTAIITIVIYLIQLVLQKLILRSGESRAARTETILDDLAIEIVRNVKKYFMFFLSLYLGLIWVKIEPRNRLLIDKAFILIALFQFAMLAGLIINFWVAKHLKVKSSTDYAMASTLGLINISVKSVVYSILFLLALNNLGVDITALIAGLGVGGIAVALALQNILGDLFASLTIVLDKPFIVGDFIVVGDFMGSVEHIGIKTTRVRSISGEQLVFGNGDLLQSRIKNYKRMAERRIVQNLTVTYQTSSEMLEKIPSIIKKIIVNQTKARFDRCHFLRFQDSSLEFELVYWVESAEFNDYADRAHAINLAIFKEFNHLKIDFAYPTRTLHIHK